MAARVRTELQTLSESGDYYYVALDLYDRGSRRIQKISEWVDENVPALADSIDVHLPKDEAFRVFSVGAGNGVIDVKILSHLRNRTHSKIHAVIIEPDSHMLQKYQDLVTKESTKLQGVDFDWRQQTFQEYQATTKEDEKFNFISSLSSIYYLGDVEKSLQYLYDKLASGGVLFLTLMKGHAGLGQLWKYLQTKGSGRHFFTSAEVEEVARKQNIPLSTLQKIKIQCDISPCFDPPDQLSKDGSTLLDFLTHTVNFAQNAPTDYREEVSRLLRSETCSERGSAGEVFLDGSSAAVIIRR